MAPTIAGPQSRQDRASSAVEVVLAAAGAAWVAGSSTPTAGPLLAVVDPGSGLDLDADAVLAALHRGQRVLVAAAPGTEIAVGGCAITVSFRPLEVASLHNPLVAESQVDATVGSGPLAGAVLTTRELAPVAGGTPLAYAAGDVVVVTSTHIDAGTLVVVGSSRLVEDEHLAAGCSADIVVWLLSGGEAPTSDLVRSHLVGGGAFAHATPPVIHTEPAAVDLSLLPADARAADPEFVRAAGRSGRLLPAAVHDALVDFTDHGDVAGAMLIRGLPVGDVPATPDRPTTPPGKDRTSEFVLLTVARRLGQPVGYRPEHGGDLVQNILPVRGAEGRQISTSSKVELMFHTEAAFHPHRPRYLLLLCLRGDPRARTTLASIREVVHMLPLGTRRTLFEPRFRTAADESYVGARPTQLGLAIPVLAGQWDEPTLVFDADLMVGIDDDADDALRALSAAVAACHTGVVLEQGDLLVVDNSVAVHGRSPFVPRFDGTDRWLQRTFVVSDLAPSAGEAEGRIIATRFAA